MAVQYGTRWVGGVNDGTTGATDAWQSATPVVETTGLTASFTSGRALHISVPADGSSTPGGTATAPSGAYQRCEQYPDLSAISGVTGGTWGPGFTGYFGLSVLLDADFPTNPRESGGGVAWQVITQWKNDGTGSPPLELKIGNGQLFLDGNSGGWSQNICPVTAGQRYNIVLQLTFTESASTSTANVWVNGTQYLTNFHPTGAGFLYTGVRSYWKAGIYRETGLPTQAKASLWYGALAFDAAYANVNQYLLDTTTDPDPGVATPQIGYVAAGVSTANQALKTATPTIVATNAVSANAGEWLTIKATTGLATHVPTSVAVAGGAGGITWLGPFTDNLTAETPLVYWYGFVNTAFTNQTVTVTCTITGSTATTTGVFFWERLTGVDPTGARTRWISGSGTNGSAFPSGGPYTLTATGVAAGTWVSWLAGDYNGVRVTGVAYPNGDTAEANYINATAGTLTAFAGGKLATAAGSVTAGYTATGTNTSVVGVFYLFPPAAAATSISSDFTAGVPAFFNANFGGVSVDGNGQAQVPTINTYAAFKTAAYYSLTGGAVYVQVVTASGVSGSRQNSLKLAINTNNSVEMMLDGGVFKGRLTKAGVNTDTTLGTYSATTHAYWRIREAAGTLYWDTSPNGATWTNLGSAVHGLNLAAVQVLLQAGYWNASEPGLPAPNAVYDNFNIVGAGANYAQTATDTAGAADSATPTIQTTRTLTDTAGAADPLGQAATSSRSAPDDAIGALDIGPALTTGYQRAATDAIGDADSFIQGIPAERDPLDEIGVADSVTTGIGLGYVVDPDAIGVTDSQSYTLGDEQDTTDAIGAVDSFTWQADYEPAPTDPIGAADSANQVVDHQREVDDAFGVADSSSGLRGQYAAVGDAIGVADSLSAPTDHTYSITDTAGTDDSSLGVGAPAGRVLVDSAPVVDFVNVDVHGRSATVAADEVAEADTGQALVVAGQGLGTAPFGTAPFGEGIPTSGPVGSMPVPVAVETSSAFSGTTQASVAAGEVAEVDSTWTPTPTGSYPTAEAGERDIVFTPIVLVDDGEFGVAITDVDRTPIFKLMADWNRNGLYDHPLSDLTDLVTDVSIDRALTGSLPVEVGLVEGYSSAALTATLEGLFTPSVGEVIAPSSRTNLMPNPSVETNTTGYSVVTTGTLTGVTVATDSQSPGAVAGTKYLLARPTAGTTSGFTYIRCPLVAVTPGSSYTASAYRYTIGTVNQANVGIDWLDSNQNQIAGSVTGSAIGGGGWVRGSVTGAAPTGAAFARVFLQSGTVDYNDYTRWDAVMLEVGTTLGFYFDGDSASCGWNGTPHASTSTYYPAPVPASTIPEASIDVVDVFAPYRPDSPLYGQPLLRTPIYLETGFIATDGPRLQRRFTGTVSQINPASAARSVKIGALDPSTQLRGTLTMPGAGMFSSIMAAQGPDVYRSRINSQWLIDQALRANGIYASPPDRADAILAVTGHGAMIPHVGWGGAPSEYYPTYRGRMWVQSPFGTGTIANINGGNGTWWLTDQVTAAAGDGFGFSMWMAMYPAGASGDWRDLQMDLTTDGSWFFDFGTDAQGRPYVGMVQKGQTEIRATAFNYVPPTAANGAWQFVGVHVAFAATSMTATFRIGGATYFGSATLPARPGNWKPGLFINYSWYGPITNFQMWKSTTPPTAPWQGEDPNFVPQADLDPGSNELTAIPELNEVNTWELIKAVTDAEGSTFQFTEDGRPQFRSIAGDTYYGRTKTVSERITADRNLADLVATTDESTIRNVITTKTKMQLVSDWQDYYVSPDVNAFNVGASTTSYFELDLPGAAYDIPPPLSTFGCLPTGSPGWNCWSSAGGTGFIFFITNDTWNNTATQQYLRSFIRAMITRSDQIGTVVQQGVQIRVVRTSPWTMQVIINNQNTFPIRMATAATIDTNTNTYTDTGNPALIIPARIVEQGPEQIETLTDNGSVATYGAASFDIGGSDENWRQRPEGFRGLASEVLATTAHPVPVLDAVDVPHDPRRKLGDRVILEDPGGLGEVMGSIVTLNQTYSTQGAMDKIGVRPLAPPGLGLLDDATHGLLDSSLVLGP